MVRTDYLRGHEAARERDRANLASCLGGLVRTGELSANVAREIMVAVHGVQASDAEFGPDPDVEKLLNNM